MNQKTELSYINKKLTVLVVGYDGYIDVWNHDFALMNRYWKDRPRTILADAELRPDYDGVEVLNAGNDAEWSKKLIRALQVIETDYVILLLEDFFICDYVDNKKLLHAIQLMDNDHIDFYQLSTFGIIKNRYKGKPYKGNKKIKIVPIDRQYPINLQAAIWRKSFLQEKVGKGNYNAWVFELNHINEEVNTGKITCLVDTTNMLNITHGIVQSKYLRAAKRKLNRLGCNITDTERTVFSVSEDFKYQLKKVMSTIIPRKYYHLAKMIGRQIGIDFVSDRIK